MSANAATDDTPDDATSSYLKGNGFSKNGEYAKAIAAYDHALQLHPEFPKAYNNRGVAYLALEDYDQAIADFGHALQYDPTLAQAYYNQGRAYFFEDNFQSAITNFGQAIRFKPDYADAYNNRGTAYLQLKQYSRAYADFQRAVEINPGDHLAQHNLSEVEKKVGPRHAPAEAPVAPAPAPTPAPTVTAPPISEPEPPPEPLPSDPKPANEQALIRREALDESKGNYTKAIADCTKAIGLDPTNAAAFNDRGTDHAALGQYDDALADYNTAIALQKSARYDDPKRAQYFCNRGLCHEAKGDHANAIADYTTAIQIDPGLLGAHNSLAWTLATCPQARLRNGERAMTEATKACELSGWKDPAYWDTLAAAAAEAGDFSTAIKWQAKCVESPAVPASQKAGAQARLALYREHRAYHEGA